MDSEAQLRRLELIKELVGSIRTPSQSADPGSYPKLYERYLQAIENVVGMYGSGLLHFDDYRNSIGCTSDRSFDSTVCDNRKAVKPTRLSLAHIVRNTALPSPQTPVSLVSPSVDQVRRVACNHGYPPDFACGYCDGSTNVNSNNSRSFIS